MGRNMKSFVAILSSFALGAAVAAPLSAAEQAQARMMNAKGELLGVVELTQTANGVLLKGQLKPLPKGEHAFHVHAVGKCDAAAGFSSAGGHFALERKHGFKMLGGAHPGDMVNLHVPDNESLSLETFNHAITLVRGVETSIMDADGSALVIHAGPDDYESQPAGNSGDRIACGVIEAR